MKKSAILLTLLTLFVPSLASAGMYFNVDNDIFLGAFNLNSINEDRNYTQGVRLGFSGPTIPQQVYTLHTYFDKFIAEKIPMLIDAGELQPLAMNSVHIGLLAYTPDILNTTAVQRDDRPYGSIFYFSTQREHIAPCEPKGQCRPERKLITEMRFGVLGYRVAEDSQTWMHELINDNNSHDPYNPKGWSNQISDGGELTALYIVTRLNRYRSDSPHWMQMVSGQSIYAGYQTGWSGLFEVKLGRIRQDSLTYTSTTLSSPQILNAQQESPQSEVFGYLSLKPSLILYDALLMGQFKHNEHDLSWREIKPVTLDAELGFNLTYKDVVGVRVFIAGRTSEMYIGPSRIHAWAGITINVLYR